MPICVHINCHVVKFLLTLLSEMANFKISLLLFALGLSVVVQADQLDTSLRQDLDAAFKKEGIKITTEVHSKVPKTEQISKGTDGDLT